MRSTPVVIASLALSLSAPVQAARSGGSAAPEIAFERRELSREFFCEGATFADLDRDGHADVISGPFWYRGPAFSEKREIYAPAPFDPAGYSNNFFAFARDFDGDGWLDVLIVGFPGADASWFENPREASGPWKRHLAFATIDNESPAFTDLTGDGRPELVFHTGGRLGWAGPDARDPRQPWTFHPLSEDLGLQRFTHGLGVGDVDGDGRADVLLKSGWWKQPASLANDPPWERHDFAFSGRQGGAQMLVYDVDGDGDNDVITSLAAHGFGLSWWEHVEKSGVITFAEHRIMDDDANAVRFAELHALALADVDGDGLLDIVTGKRWWSHGAQGDPMPGSPAVVYWFGLERSKADGARYVPHLADDDSGVGVQVVAGDVDGDKKTDVVIGNKKGTFVLLQRQRTESGAAKRALTEKEKIEALLAAVESSNVKFIRNGDAHTPQKAAEHLRTKWKAAGSDVKTARDFIEQLATKSSLSGKPYQIELAGGKRVPSAEWLLEKLAAIEAPAPTPPAAPAPAPPPQQGSQQNLDFERGDLSGWTATGEAFIGQPIRGDTVTARGREPSLHEGNYWIGGYERVGDGAEGTLVSAPFEVTQPWASFLVGGGSGSGERVELVREGEEQSFFRASGPNYESMQRVVVDLSLRVGQRIFVRLVDRQTGGWGHVNFDDFRFHAEEPSFARPPGVPAILPPDAVKNAGLAPLDALEAMSVPEGFRVEVVASEPDLHQPVALAIDAKGRLWVAEAFTYPVRQPEGEGKDDIVVFEDLDRDGRFERRTVFAKGLNLVSGLEVGFGGVWIGAAPHFAFLADRNDDLVPDGPPEILLDGWGYQDTHETLNSFIWGPDGWLYGCHGVFTYSRVGKPGTPDDARIPLNAAVWRFHPTRREFEVFAEGTSNPWGVDFNDRGQAFITACVIPHLYHVIQGGYYERQAGGPSNPFVFDEIKTIADHLHYLGDSPHGGNLRSDAAGGGHAHCGALLYLGERFPAQYRDTILMGNIHGNRLNNDVLERKGSGYVGRHGADFLLSNDQWFRPISTKLGPDGSLYLIDWYDKQACHETNVERWDRTNGRLYRVSYGAHVPASVDSRASSDQKFLEFLTSDNEWLARAARLTLQERGRNPTLAAYLAASLVPPQDEPKRLRRLWALHAIGGLTEEIALAQLASPQEYVSAWTIQLLAERKAISGRVQNEFARLARESKSPVVRLYLAAALQRLAPADRWVIAVTLATHAEDAADPNLPRMLWYAVEPLVTLDPGRALGLMRACKIEMVARFIVRRLALDPAQHELLVGAVAEEGDAARRGRMLEEIEQALHSQRGLAMPAGWPALYRTLAADSDPAVRERAKSIGVAFGDVQLFLDLRKTLADEKAAVALRLRALDVLVRGADAETAPILARLLSETALRSAALRGLASFDDPRAAGAILERYASFNKGERSDALNTLCARASSARQLLTAVERGAVPREDLSAFVLRNLRNLGDAQLDRLLAATWGVVRESPRDKAARIAALKDRLGARALDHADLPRGREVFSRTCAQCHVLFGKGGTLGPDLTGSNRADLDYLLSNLVDPSAIVGKEYLATMIWLEDERLVTGILRGENASSVTLQTENEMVTIAKDDIAERKASELSTMPEGLLDTLAETEVRDLVAYLRSPAQVPMLATPLNVRQLFDGKTLAGWSGSAECWRVENGEIIGKTAGLAHNEFLKSDLELRDFRLIVEMRLADDAGNSGIQFRTQALAGGEVRGYQADAGPGWWGKLYEEEGRGLLSDRSGEEFVRKGAWNRYEVVAVGHRVLTAINGQPCVDLDDPRGALGGILALQIHSGGPTEVRFRDFHIELDPQPVLTTKPESDH